MLLLCAAAASVMGVGLVRSYSRGAWAGAAAGLALLLVQASTLREERRTSNVELPTLNIENRTWLGQNWLSVAVILVSASVLVFWNLGGVESPVARRAVSVANANDFSWRNRVAAWEGALQMMAERPWLGFGWNQPEPIYDGFYRPAGVSEGAAIQLNDYFTLGATLGIPALVCFGMYVWLALTRKPESRKLKAEMERGDWLRGVCRAGAIVLLVGFWFDGGLFKLATAGPFWILMELGREDGERLKAEG